MHPIRSYFPLDPEYRRYRYGLGFLHPAGWFPWRYSSIVILIAIAGDELILLVHVTEIHLVQALYKYKNPKSTKGNKKTTFRIPNELTDLLQE